MRVGASRLLRIRCAGGFSAYRRVFHFVKMARFRIEAVGFPRTEAGIADGAQIVRGWARRGADLPFVPGPDLECIEPIGMSRRDRTRDHEKP